MNRQRRRTGVLAAAGTRNSGRIWIDATGMRAIRRMGVAAMLVMSVLVTHASAATLYWDINGATPGAGGTQPAGTWDAATENWSSSAAGDVATETWASGNTAVFAAGTGATGAYTVTVAGTQDIGGLTFEEGTVTLSGGSFRMVTNSIFNVATGRSANLASTLTDDGTAPTLTKNGAGTLTVNGPRTYTGETIVNAGTLILITVATYPLTVNNTGILKLESPTGAFGTVTVNAGGVLSMGSAGGNVRISIGTLNLNGGTVQRHTSYNGLYMTGSGNIRAAGETTSTITAPVLCNQNNFTYNMDVESGSTLLISGAVGKGLASGVKLTKGDVGTLILSGNNTYDGATTVNSGGLIVNGSTAASSDVNVASGARIGGDGTIGGNLTLAGGAALVFDPEWTLTINSGKNLSFGATYTPLDLVQADGSAIDWDALDSTTFTLVGGEGTVDFTNISTDTFNAGTTGRQVFFKQGGLQLEVLAPPPKATVIIIQ